jgi:LPS-assembly protein
MSVLIGMAKLRQFRNTAKIVLFGLYAFWLWPAPAASAQTSANTVQVRTEIPYRDCAKAGCPILGTAVLLSDFQEKVGNRYNAQGHVLITYKDMSLSSDEATYDPESQDGVASGHVRFTQQEQWLACAKAEFNFGSQTGVFYDASGYTDRQFSIVARTIRKTGPDTYQTEKVDLTACKQKRPKWSFSSSKAIIQADHTARLRGTVFKLEGIPAFYVPYFIIPLEKKTRSSGFVPFRTGTSTTKGRLFSEGYYQTLGESADLMIHGDYFTLRGLAVGGIFRAKPNPTTHFVIEAYGIKDKLNQGGILLSVDGESLLRDDWRAVARVNITSNFSFRQAFADNFRAATVSQEHAIAFLTRNHSSFSTNIEFQRDEVVFPVHSLIIKKLPSLEFLSLGTPVGHSPFILSFRASLDGVSRLDSSMETEKLVQRLDFYPRLTLRLPSISGFSLTPSMGVRETYYGAQISEVTPSGTINRDLNRKYADLNVDLRMPVLERDFSSTWLGTFQHAVEPFAAYRLIRGIEDFDRIIRFDEQDAIADTNEIEYGIVNRIFKEHQTGAGTQEKSQFMSFSLRQKYYLDPTFGGAFTQNRTNSFYPLDTLTGLYQTGIAHNFSPISAVVQISPQNGIHYDFRTDFDPKIQRWRNESFSTLWQQGKFYLEGTFLRAPSLEQEHAEILVGNTFQGLIRYGLPTSGLSTSFSLSYNIQTSRLLNSLTRLNYTWDCCGLSAEFNQYDLGFRTESRFSFSFTLKGIGSFGNLKRPESLF